jgi:hypothetical protein
LKEQSMPLPTPKTLVRDIGEALEIVARMPWNEITHDEIASQIARRFEENPKIKCYGGRRAPKGCAGSEWLFDFCALLYAEPLGFVAQAVIIGETEWKGSDKETDWDFEKLLIVDSIVCFFVCGVKTQEEATKKLQRYEEVVRVRNEYAMKRGGCSPSFLLACYVEPQVGTLPPKLRTCEVSFDKSLKHSA